MQISDTPVGFRLVSEDGTHHVGSILIQDSTFNNVTSAVVTSVADTRIQDGIIGLTLDNIALSNVQNAIVDTAGKSMLEGNNVNIGECSIMPWFKNLEHRS